MAGQLDFEGSKPKVGDKVYILVDEVNKHTGFWEGELVTIEPSTKHHNRKGSRAPCTAVIIKDGERVAPGLNYRVLITEGAVQHLLRLREDDRKEVNGLRKRMQIEREHTQAIFRSIVSNEAMEKLQVMLDDFLKRLKG